MDVSWSAPGWIVTMALMLGAGAALLAHWTARWWGHRPKRNMARWLAEVEQRMLSVVYTSLRAAEARAELAELIGELPSDFNADVFLALDLSAGFQRAALFEAEQKGLVPGGTFARIYGSTVLGPPQTPGEEPQIEVAPASVAPAEAARWVGTYRVG